MQRHHEQIRASVSEWVDASSNRLAKVLSSNEEDLKPLKEKFSIKQIRSIFLFLGIGEVSAPPFSVPVNGGQLTSRLNLNFSFFMLNYILLAFTILCFILLGSFFNLFWVLLLAAGWTVVIKPIPIVIQNRAMTPSELRVIMIASTFATVLLFLLPAVIQTLFYSSIICLGHSVLRETSTYATTINSNTEEDDIL